jgi:hypothetical protein
MRRSNMPVRSSPLLGRATFTPNLVVVDPALTVLDNVMCLLPHGDLHPALTLPTAGVSPAGARGACASQRPSPKSRALSLSSRAPLKTGTVGEPPLAIPAAAASRSPPRALRLNRSEFAYNFASGKLKKRCLCGRQHSAETDEWTSGAHKVDALVRNTTRSAAAKAAVRPPVPTATARAWPVSMWSVGSACRVRTTRYAVDDRVRRFAGPVWAHRRAGLTAEEEHERAGDRDVRERGEREPEHDDGDDFRLRVERAELLDEGARGGGCEAGHYGEARVSVVRLSPDART